MADAGPVRPSLHDLPPLERGGVVARIGFTLQDHVAVSFLIDLLLLPELLKVWCETLDDITLIWQGTHSEDFEFVQVKGLALDQLWSLAKVTQRDRKDKSDVAGSSIYERHLANDRGIEPSRFRLVTSLPPNSDLEVLQLPFDAPDRLAKAKDLEALAVTLDARVDQFKSPNGNGAAYWLSRMQWNVRQSAESLANDSKFKLHRYLVQNGTTLFPDQLDELYSALLTMARDAATAEWGVDPSRKKICKACVSKWLNSYLDNRRHPPVSGGSRLKDKLHGAGVPDGDISASLESRQRYLAERYSPQYMKGSDLALLEDEVSAVLQGLRSKLDSGELPDDGVSFHAACLKAMEDLRGQFTGSVPPLSVLQGCMYNVADRCVHRFRRATA